MTTQTHSPLDMEQFREALRKHSLKATSQRLAVHEAMLSLGHACADMVAQSIEEKEHASVTVASVYNILTQLSEIGIYSRRMSHGNKMFFDVNTFAHMHLYDTTSHSYSDVVDDELMALLQKHIGKRRFKGMKVEGIDLQILCRPRRSSVKKKTEKK